MTDAELEAIEADFRHTPTPILVAEVRRLRGLLEKAQHRGQFQYCTTCHNCPWCGYDATLDTKRKHAPECPAFTENGEVR